MSYSLLTNGSVNVVAGVAFAASLGATTMVVPGFVSAERSYTSASDVVYSNQIYSTGFKKYIPSKSYSDEEKIAIINDLVKSVTVGSRPLTTDEHSLLSDNLFDLL